MVVAVTTYAQTIGNLWLLQAMIAMDIHKPITLDLLMRLAKHVYLYHWIFVVRPKEEILF